MIISVASGKGGTGKTTVAINLALAVKNTQFFDCDVEAPDGYIFLKPQIEQTIPVHISVPKVDKDKCVYCGLCSKACQFNALNVFKTQGEEGGVIFLPNLCHSCSACWTLCPKEAIKKEPLKIGIIESGKAKDMPYFCGKLDTGDVRTPFLINRLKESIDNTKTTVLDCPPGTSCPMVAAVDGSDFCVLVTEPSPFGLNDLSLAVETLKKMNIKHGVFINRAGGSDIIETYCEQNGVKLLGSLPFDVQIAKSYATGGIISEELPQYKEIFCKLADDIFAQMQGEV